jgi:hypothetical protein
LIEKESSGGHHEGNDTLIDRPRETADKSPYEMIAVVVSDGIL